MHSLLRAFAPVMLALGLATAIHADTETDLRQIVHAIYSDATVDANFEVMQPYIASMMNERFRAAGVSVSDPDGYIRIYTEALRAPYVEILRSVMAPVIEQMFTPADLADIAAFARTPSGRKFFASQGDLARAGTANSQVAWTQAALEAAPRIAEQLDQRGIRFTGPDGNRIEALKVLRGY